MTISWEFGMIAVHSCFRADCKKTQKLGLPLKTKEVLFCEVFRHFLIKFTQEKTESSSGFHE